MYNESNYTNADMIISKWHKTWGIIRPIPTILNSAYMNECCAINGNLFDSIVS